ncbi:C6 zinc finger protein [Colletotrichum tofieldiae]|nr:C6 zinc finger protein [Colletotrichum tofieldiae]GKT73011.1 C6 zinc finger protein [Colletotrichum tofieldiae]GKT89139.1 C6 zinc finger protein [Colletotrichum tofieldiae]
MGIREFFDGRFFDTRYRTKVHILQLVLMTVAIILTIARMSMPVPTTRANMMALTMGLKSLIIIGYQLLTTHKERFKKWASLKANAILNTLEIVFWFVAFGLLCSANGTFCTGTSCALSWVVTLLVMVLIVLAFQTSVVSIKDYRYFKNYGVNPETEARAAYPKPQV